MVADLVENLTPAVAELDEQEGVARGNSRWRRDAGLGAWFWLDRALSRRGGHHLTAQGLDNH